MRVVTKITIEESTHLIKNAPLNHVLNMNMCDGNLITESGSWELGELLKFRREKHMVNDIDDIKDSFCNAKLGVPWEPGELACSFCGEIFESEVDLEAHKFNSCCEDK